MKHQRTFVFSLVILILVVLTACVQVSPEESIEAAPQQSEAAPVITEENEPLSDYELFVVNPELMTVRRYLIEVEAETPTDSDFYAANPELMAAGRYAAAIEKESMSGSTFYAANPELMKADRYAAPVVENEGD